VSWRAFDPSPFRAWIRWAPRSWPPPPRPCFDFATRRISWPARGESESGPLPAALPIEAGITYLPPAPAAAHEAVEGLVLRLAAAGSIALRHATVGETGPADDAPGEETPHWIDPLAGWLAGETPDEWLASARGIAGPRAIVVPLAGGLTPTGAALDAWLAAITALAPVAVVGVAAELTPGDRRRAVEGLGEASFDQIFHGAAPSEHEFARLVAARGLRPLSPRPALPGAPGRSARNHQLAAALWEAAELALRLAAPEAECAALFAAARHLEASSLDVAALRREGNLGVLSWLAPAARGVVDELLAGGESARLEALRREWRGRGAE
jgi:hypothetical protein